MFGQTSEPGSGEEHLNASRTQKQSALEESASEVGAGGGDGGGG